jgi:hypothetical protein
MPLRAQGRTATAHQKRALLSLQETAEGLRSQTSVRPLDARKEAYTEALGDQLGHEAALRGAAFLVIITVCNLCVMGTKASRCRFLTTGTVCTVRKL